MKRLLTLSLFALFFASCSTDDSAISENQDNAVETSNAYKMAPSVACFEGVTGSVSANDIINPTLTFTAHATSTVRIASTNNYKFYLQFQPLSDCDNMDSNTGTVTQYEVPGYVINPLTYDPSISIASGNLPSGCYKWRFVTQGVRADGVIFCVTSSVWYEAPLF